jgi:hypothetical protein
MHVRGRGLVDQDGCLWSQLPRTIVELQVMRYALLKANKGTALPTLEGWGGDGTCGFAKDSLRNAVNDDTHQHAAAAARELTSVPPIRCDILICVKTTTLTGCFGGCAVPSYSGRPTTVDGEEVDVGIWVRGSGPEGRAGTDSRFDVLVRDFTPDGMAECSFTVDGTPLKDRTQACDSRLGQVQVTVE